MADARLDRSLIETSPLVDGTEIQIEDASPGLFLVALDLPARGRGYEILDECQELSDQVLNGSDGSCLSERGNETMLVAKELQIEASQKVRVADALEAVAREQPVALDHVSSALRFRRQYGSSGREWL